MMSSVYETLAKIDVSDHVEKKRKPELSVLGLGVARSKDSVPGCVLYDIRDRERH
jgi:hypothetical protein